MILRDQRLSGWERRSICNGYLYRIFTDRIVFRIIHVIFIGRRGRTLLREEPTESLGESRQVKRQTAYPLRGRPLPKLILDLPLQGAVVADLGQDGVQVLLAT